jgi:glycine cleavage system H protein
MPAPTDRKYLKSHEWHQAAGDTVTIGITQFAADELTDITYVALPEVGAKISANESFGEIESVKATGDLYSGVSGEVIEINEQLKGDPSLINTDPHGKGWMIKVRMSDRGELDKLMSGEEYNEQIGG